MSGWAGCKHSPSSSSVMAVDSNKVGPPKGDWGITNRKQMPSYFCFMSLKVVNSHIYVHVKGNKELTSRKKMENAT